MFTRRMPRSVWGSNRVGAVAGTASLLTAAALFPTAAVRADTGAKEITVVPQQMTTEKVVWKPSHAIVTPPFGTRDPGCSPVVSSVANQFNNIDVGGEITLQAGMVVNEGFGSTYPVPDPVPGTSVNEAFPIEVNLVEFIAGTAATLSGSDGSNIRLGWAIEVWDGEPYVGTSSIVFYVASDPDPSSTGLPGDLVLARVPGAPACDQFNVLLGGAQASMGKVQFSVDPSADASDRMIVPGNATDAGGAPLNDFTVVVTITALNSPGANACATVDLCNNAFLATEGSSVNGSSNPATPTYPTRDWLDAVTCPGGCPGGYTRFSNLGSGCRPSRDVLQQVTYTPAFCVGAVTGACCGTAGGCTSTTSTACTGTSTYQGDNTLCQPSPCPQPTGACCALNGTCSVGAGSACTAPAVFQGSGTTCGPQSCLGACCFGTGCLTAIASDCADAGGVYQGYSSACAGSSCPTGACCIASTGACSTQTQAACTAQGGVFGSGVACSTTFCPLPTGACCASNGACLGNQTQSACQSVNFRWQGGGTTCAAAPCSSGVCCRGSTCTVGLTQANCTSPGSGIGASFTSAASACNTSGNNASPCCYADFNKTNGVTVEDIFDFLQAWFAASPYAQYGGGSGSPVVQDIFNFLAGWFAGC